MHHGCNTPRSSSVTSEQYEAGSANMSDLSLAGLAQVCPSCVSGATHARQKQLSDSVAAPKPKATHRCFCTGDSYSNKPSHTGSSEVTLFLVSLQPAYISSQVLGRDSRIGTANTNMKLNQPHSVHRKAEHRVVAEGADKHCWTQDCSLKKPTASQRS